MEKKDYIFISGKHTVPSGKEGVPDIVLKKGDKIALTDEQAKALENKVVLADSTEAKIAFSGGGNAAAQVQVDANAQAEIERLKAALADKEAELEAKAKELAEFVE